MTQVAEVVALVTAAVNLLAAALGAWRWWTVEPSQAFWVLCRIGQALAVVQALVAGVLAALGFPSAWARSISCAPSGARRSRMPATRSRPCALLRTSSLRPRLAA